MKIICDCILPGSCVNTISFAPVSILCIFMSHALSGCLCDLGLQNVDPYCKMTSEELFHLPLNVYIIILGIGTFILMLSLIFCCYLFRYKTTDKAELELLYRIGSVTLLYWTSISMFLKIRRHSVKLIYF